MLKNSVTMVTITSTANSSLHQLRTFNSENKNNHPRDASFSSYLNSNEKKGEDGQIEVFEAQKYFNEGMDHESPRVTNMAARQYQYQKDEEHTVLETRNYRKSHYGTPSVRSESSWNSQSKLLQAAQRKSSRNNKKKVQGKSFLASLGCKCSCTDKNSVDISVHNKTPTYGVVHVKRSPKNIFNTGPDVDYSAKTNNPCEELLFNKDVYLKRPDLAFSTVNPMLDNQLADMKLQQEEEEKPRKSLEVFGSPKFNDRRSLTFDRRLTRPSWDAAAPKLEEIDLSGANYNDTESDASSDLFEIDSLTGKSNHFLNRQTSEVASGCVSPTTCYAPSEASIEWSVATASAVEYSAMSDSEEQAPVPAIATKTAFTFSNGTAKASRETHRRNPSMLLGCKSHNAVRVAGDAFITYEKTNSSPLIRRRSDTLTQVTRFKPETKMGNFGATYGQHAHAKPPLQRSYSSHASQRLYI